MGNLDVNCAVIHFERRKGDASESFDEATGKEEPGAGEGGSSNTREVSLKSELQGIHERPTAITMVLSNALYSVEFHKHLTVT